MLHRLWGYVFRRAVMRDADRLMKAHGEGAYGLALIGVRAARECGRDGHWSAVAREIVRRTGKVAAPHAAERDAPLWYSPHSGRSDTRHFGYSGNLRGTDDSSGR